MFNMKNVGRKISLLRKEKNLTQMELADMLNISYQAVSNWERGETMPDISKLPEIAQIFDTSIDNILGNNSTARLVNNIINTDLSNDIIAVDEFKSITPILKPTQISEISNKISYFDNMNDLLEYIPFVSKTIADKIAKKCIENNYISLDELVPFISKDLLEELINLKIQMIK
ncbi:helix-turn-helix domain-containing protein [Clostridium tertium]